MKFTAFFEQYNQITTPHYYKELDNHLRKYGYQLGENKFNPDLGWANPKERGIYEGDRQIGKIDLYVKDGVLYLEHIKSYGKHYKQNFELLEKIYPFHREQASKYSLIVKAELVNPKTDNMFRKIFANGFDVTDQDSVTMAVPNI